MSSLLLLCVFLTEEHMTLVTLFCFQSFYTEKLSMGNAEQLKSNLCLYVTPIIRKQSCYYHVCFMWPKINKQRSETISNGFLFSCLTAACSDPLQEQKQNKELKIHLALCSRILRTWITTLQLSFSFQDCSQFCSSILLAQ